MRKPLIPFTIIRRSTLGRLKERRKADNRVVSNLMAMNHQLIQVFNRIPPKFKKGLTARVKDAKNKGP